MQIQEQEETGLAWIWLAPLTVLWWSHEEYHFPNRQAAADWLVAEGYEELDGFWSLSHALEKKYRGMMDSYTRTKGENEFARKMWRQLITHPQRYRKYDGKMTENYK